ncbi:hypothetical protein HPB51_002851 [Rhipicephalus microplus]|uniref:CN hydrolase domain-containing protein n=1 Tax=Rhipicephalus microplus TaxID=6941 RepID=A0A9J6EW19_RHIMP|nr:hypothetical protein HPB51_002851 [Rhipicephalus microplus]
MAQNNSIYLVANLIDRKPCNESDHSCPRDKVKYFNTNVAFDRNGTLVARYHKNHLFIEPFMNPADPYEFAVFNTDFDARVGLFICFDVLFAESSLLVREAQCHPGRHEQLVVRRASWLVLGWSTASLVHTQRNSSAGIRNSAS